MDRSAFNGTCWRSIQICFVFETLIRIQNIEGSLSSGALFTPQGKPYGIARGKGCARLCARSEFTGVDAMGRALEHEPPAKDGQSLGDQSVTPLVQALIDQPLCHRYCVIDPNVSQRERAPSLHPPHRKGGQHCRRDGRSTAATPCGRPSHYPRCVRERARGCRPAPSTAPRGWPAPPAARRSALAARRRGCAAHRAP